MLTSYERHFIRRCISNLLGTFDDDSAQHKKVFKKLQPFSNFLGWPEAMDGMAKAARLQDWLNTGSRAVRRDQLAIRIESLGRHLRLTRTDLNLLELSLRYGTHSIIEHILDKFTDDPGQRGSHKWFLSVRNQNIPSMLGTSAGHLRSRLRSDSPLLLLGLMQVDDDGEIRPSSCMWRLVRAPTERGTDAPRVLFGKSPAPQLTWRDFDHVAEQRDHVERLIKGAANMRNNPSTHDVRDGTAPTFSPHPRKNLGKRT